MFKSTKEFDKAVREILVAIRDGKNLQEVITQNGSDNYYEALARCCDMRYIVGIKYERTLDNAPHFDLQNPKITYSGLQFIEAF